MASKKKTTSRKAIDWAADFAELEHAEGSAGDVPGLLSVLADPEAAVKIVEKRLPRRTVREDAIKRLWQLLWSDEAWFSAQPRFVGELFALARAPATPKRAELLAFIAEVWARGTGDKVPRGLDLDERETSEIYAAPVPQRLRAMLEENTPFLVNLLESEEAALRANAAALLAFVPEAACAAAGPLEAHIAREGDDAVRGVLLHALGLSTRKDAQGPAALTERTMAGTPVTRACAFTALFARGEGPLSDDAFSAFVDALMFPKLDSATFPWKAGQLDEFIFECVHARTASIQTINALCLAALSRPDIPEANASKYLDLLVTQNFEEKRYPLRGELTLDQVKLADAISSFGKRAPFAKAGLPEDPKLLRRWLGLDPPGPLNAPVVLKKKGRDTEWPLWKAIVENAVGDLERYLVKAFSPEAILDIYLDDAALPGEEGYHDFDLGLLPLTKSLDKLGARAIPWADRYIAATRGKSPLGNFPLLAVVRALPEGASLDPKYDSAVSAIVPFGDSDYAPALAEVMAKIPEDRREAIALRGIESTRGAEGLFADVFKLAPTARVTRALLETLDGKRGLEGYEGEVDEERAQRTLGVVLAEAKSRAEVASAIAHYEAESEFLKSALAKAKKALRSSSQY